MKKYYLVISMLMSLVYPLQAQFTLTSANFFVSATDDTVYLIANGGALAPNPSATFWDYSNLSTASAMYYFDSPADNAAFPAAQVGKEVFYALGNAQIFSRLNSGSASNGYLEYGFAMDQQTIPLTATTGGANDKLVFPAQNYTYTTPQILLPFPATANTTWSSNVLNVSNFNLTVAVYGLNNAPGQRKTHLFIEGSVPTVGQMIVPTATGASIPYEVIMVKERDVRVDSFYLGGQPAPPALLNAFGLVQGEKDTLYYTKFYSTTNERPFFLLEHGADKTYQTVTAGHFMLERVQTATGIADAALQNAVKVYPNPTSERLLFVNLPENVQVEAWEIVNNLGQVMARETHTNHSPMFSISLPQSLSAGCYHLKMKVQGTSNLLNKTFLFQP